MYITTSWSGEFSGFLIECITPLCLRSSRLGYPPVVIRGLLMPFGQSLPWGGGPCFILLFLFFITLFYAHSPSTASRRLFCLYDTPVCAYFLLSFILIFAPR
jgi:hypothetical protein